MKGAVRRQRWSWLAVAVGIGVIAAPVLAHHGTNISYDRTKQWTKEVVVTRFNYANPHPQLFFDMKNDKGEVESWGAELLPNPAALIRAGWTRAKANDVLKPGTHITVTIAPGKAGGTVGLLLKALNDKGEEIVTGAGPGAQPPDAAPAAPAR